MNTGAVILAAGGSRRFGTRGENKLFANHPVDGTPVIIGICRRVVAAGFQPVVAVTGYQAGRIRKVLQGLPITTVQNGRWRDGMSGSIRVGVEYIKEKCDGVAIVLGDMPRLTAETLTLLRKRFESSQGIHAVYPVYRRTQGNPVIFPRRYFLEIMTITGDQGCKRVLQAHGEDSVGVCVSSGEVLIDYDTSPDYWKIMEDTPATGNG